MDLSELGLDDEVKAYLNEQKDFIIDRISQEGGNCDIFFGHHKIFNRRIALKIYYGGDNNKSHEEARILSTLQHDNILKVRDAKRIGDYYSYFMTDEISGGDLEKVFQSGTLDLKQKLNIIHGVLNGLTELHREGISIVHRDLKPKNILIYDDSKQPLISDFGSVRQFDTNIGFVSGSNTTLLYKPKEVVDENHYTKQSDLYQLGVTMFQILGGHFPGAYFDWLTEKEKTKFNAIIGSYEQDIFIDKVIERLVSKNKLLKFETLPKYLDEQIIKVVQRATHCRLDLRYENTGAFMNDLFKIQKRLTNWQNSDDHFIAIKHTGEQFRVCLTKKGYIVERFGKLGWRRQGECLGDIESHFKDINNK